MFFKNNLYKVIFVVLIVVILTIAAIALVYVLLLMRNENKALEPLLENVSNVLEFPTPTPFPFQEITIPALRNRSYESSLGELQKVSENDNYTSYLTSYDSDGLKIYGLLTIPESGPSTNAQAIGSEDFGGELSRTAQARRDDSSKYPAIIFVHGYIVPEDYRTLVNYSSYVDYLAKSNLVVFKIDLRGHGDSEGEPGGSYYSEDYIVDTLNAVSALRNSDFVNPDKIGLWGHSMAGNVTFRSFVAGKNISALVIWAGAGYTYTDLQDYMIEDNSYKPPPVDSKRAKERQLLRDTYGAFDPNHWFWKMVAATNYLEGVKGAIQLNHAVNDNVVSIDYSRNLNALLDKTAIKHELKEYSSGGHNLTGAAFNQAMQNTVDFFRKNL